MSIGDRVRTTPGRLVLITAGLLALGLAFGVTGIGTVRGRAAVIEDVGEFSGPLSVQAQTLYRALSDADATAATAFLTGGVEPPELRQRYLDDIAQASASLAGALRDAEGPAAERLTRLGRELPVYTGLVETARAYHRQGLPLGGAYMREASLHMHGVLLVEAEAVYAHEKERLAAAQDDGARFPWAALLLGLLTVGALGAAQVHLTRRTHRLVNPGLAAATLATVIAGAWVTIAVASAAGDVEAGREVGSAQAQTLADARIAALNARANESLLLVARGDGEAFEEKVKGAAATLSGTDGLLTSARWQAYTRAERTKVEEAQQAATAWITGHTTLYDLQRDGDYEDAVALAVGSQGTAFTRLETLLGEGISAADARFDDRADSARGALTGATAGLVVLTLLLLAGVIAGMAQRIGEYR